MKRFLTSLFFLGASVVPASASTISFSAPAIVTNLFDVTVEAGNLFVGRDVATDLIIAYGFDVAVSNPAVLSFVGAMSGPLFGPATSIGGTDVFAPAFGQNGIGVEPGIGEPLLLATLRFNVIGSGPASISISSDLSDPFQGLQFFNRPFQEPIAGLVTVSTVAPTVAPTAVPEPATLLFTGIGLIGGGMLSRRSAMRVSPVHKRTRA